MISFFRRHPHEQRLAALAVGEPAQAAEVAHLESCARCRRLRDGHRRADLVLRGAWADMPIATAGAVPRADRLGPMRRLAVIPIAAAVCLVALLAVDGLLTVRGQPAGSRAPTAVSSTTFAPSGTRIVATLPGGVPDWAPDGRHLLIDGTTVVDRSGAIVSRFGGSVAWLDATHVINGTAQVMPIDRDNGAGYEPNTGVHANGHGVAAVIVAVPGCTGDPMVRWYRDGVYGRTEEKVSVFGWSSDGRLGLLGHFNCDSMDAELHGWKGPVQVVEFPSRRVLGTLPAVRGSLAFNPSATRVAAASDAVIEVLDVRTGRVDKRAGAGLLGWLDDDHLYAYDTKAAAIVLLDASTSELAAAPVASGEWQLPSASGARLVLGPHGDVCRVVTVDGTLLIDLRAAHLAVGDTTTRPERIGSASQTRWWSPDGGMLALPSADGATVSLVAVDPKRPVN